MNDRETRRYDMFGRVQTFGKDNATDFAAGSKAASHFAAALAAQLDHTPHRPTIAERAARVNWQRVDEILARVPAAPPVAGDEK